MQITDYIRANVDSNFKEDELPFEVIEKQFLKKSVLTDYGSFENKIYFLKEGIIQVLINHQEEERILDFFFPFSFFCSYSSLLKAVPSDVKILALTDCTVDMIRHENLLDAYNSSLIANKLGRIVTENLYLRKVKREKDLLTKSAEVRYNELLKHQPEIIREIPINKISQYLGIRPESLSRIRKNVIS